MISICLIVIIVQYCIEMPIVWHCTWGKLFLGLLEFLINLIIEWIMKNFLFHRFTARVGWVWAFFGLLRVGVGVGDLFSAGCGWVSVSSLFLAGCQWVWVGVTFFGWVWVGVAIFGLGVGRYDFSCLGVGEYG